MNIRLALTYMKGDPRWKGKLAIAMMLNLLPTALWAAGFLDRHGETPSKLNVVVASPVWYVVLSLAGVPLLGFGLGITRNVIAGHDVPLPEWSDSGSIVRNGLMLWGVVTIWSLPGTLLNLVGGNSRDRGGVLTLLLLVVWMTTALVQPAAEARLAATGIFREGLNIATAIRRVGANFGKYAWLLVVTGGGWMLMTALFLLIGWVFTGTVAGLWQRIQLSLELGILLEMLLLRPYLNMVLSHLIGQVYARGEPSSNQMRSGVLQSHFIAGHGRLIA